MCTAGWLSTTNETRPASQKAQIMQRVSQLMDEAKACEKKLKVSYGSVPAVLTHNVQLHTSLHAAAVPQFHCRRAQLAAVTHGGKSDLLRLLQPWLPSHRLF